MCFCRHPSNAPAQGGPHRLRPAAGERDIIPAGSDSPCHRLPRALNQRPRLAAFAMHGRRIPGRFHGAQHRGLRFGAKRGRGVVICVNPAAGGHAPALTPVWALLTDQALIAVQAIRKPAARLFDQQISQCCLIEEPFHMLVECGPEACRRALRPVPAIVRCSRPGLLNSPEHFADGNIRSRPLQPVAAAGAPGGLNQPGPPQKGEQLLQIGQGNPLPRRYVRQRHRPQGRIFRYINKGNHGIAAFGTNAHRNTQT